MSKLFEKFNLSGTSLANRIVMAPMTRARAPDDIATEAVALYYAQRATAGLIITEGTPISREGQGYLFNPGIYSPEQIAGWRISTQSVHALGGRIFAQIWHVGRLSHSSIQVNGQTPVSGTSKIAEGASAFGYDEQSKPGMVLTPAPRQLSTEEVKRVVRDFADAATNSVGAGFDGIEIHGANGYLLEQFLNPLVNDRTDEYSADMMENRLRFTLEVIDATIAKIGREKVGIRLSPFGRLFDMPHYEEIESTYTSLITALGKRGIAYVHIMDQSGFANGESSSGDSVWSKIHRLLGEFRKHLPETALILAGGLTRERAESLIAEGTIDLAAFGRPFIANPDLVARLRNEWPLAEPDVNKLYGGDLKGLIDYPPYAQK